MFQFGPVLGTVRLQATGEGCRGICRLNLPADELERFKPRISIEPLRATKLPDLAGNLLRRALSALGEELHSKGRDQDYELLRKRIIEPALRGIKPPPLAELAKPHGGEHHGSF